MSTHETNRVVLITGASGGLGEVTSHLFREAGWQVCPVARSGEGRIAADLTRPEGARLAVDQALQQAGRMDAVLHLMGGFAGGQTVEETGLEIWQQMLDVNLTAAFHVAHAVLPHLKSRGEGRMVFIGSRAGLEPSAGFSAYSVSKAGLVALVKTIALESREYGITANVVLPSTIDTPANRRAMPNADFSRWVSPASIARLLLWLTSPEAGEISGAVIPIYGRS
jgi:NAD(P)-dependent dehydrogenase (short-subunit alcohol dehydrogenase family)